MAESRRELTANDLDVHVRGTDLAKDVSGVVGHEFFFRYHIDREFTVLRATMGGVALSENGLPQLFPQSPIIFRGQPLLYFIWSGTSWGAVVRAEDGIRTYFGKLAIYR